MRNLFLALVLFTLNNCIFGQDYSFGLQFGFSKYMISDHSIKESFSNSNTILNSSFILYAENGYNYGIIAKRKLTNNTSISIEPNYTQKGFSIQYSISNDGYNYNTRLNYIQLPILVNVNFTKKISIKTGFELSYLVSASAKNIKSGFITERFIGDVPEFDKYVFSETSIIKSFDNKNDIAFCLGIRYSPIKYVGISFLYNLGMLLQKQIYYNDEISNPKSTYFHGGSSNTDSMVKSESNYRNVGFNINLDIMIDI